MDPKTQEKFDELPEMIESPVQMTDVNSRILIYKGLFKLESESVETVISGEIYFDWFPTAGINFHGIPNIGSMETLKLGGAINKIDLFIDDLHFGKCYITNTTFGGSNGDILIKGRISKRAIAGDKSIGVEKVKFSIPNFREFLGLTVKRINDERKSLSRSRIELENEDFLIYIDKDFDYKNSKDLLELKGGYMVMYAGELINKKGPILIDDIEEPLYCLSNFLTFLNGRRTSPLFIHGYFEDEVKWRDYTSYFVDPYKYVITWAPKNSVEGINVAWKKFYSLWKEKDKDNRDFLISAIHWYVEANNNSGFVEGSIIMAQTALELIYNWLLIENKKILIGKDSENINASNKLRLLLSHLGINYEIPEAFYDLRSFLESSRDVIDAPDAVVQIRNAVVHSQEEKRKKLKAIPFEAKYEALQLCISYIELALLYILDYKGDYYDRCSGTMFAYLAEKKVPWAK
jgi:hypothetical protein